MTIDALLSTTAILPPAEDGTIIIGGRRYVPAEAGIIIIAGKRYLTPEGLALVLGVSRRV